MNYVWLKEPGEVDRWIADLDEAEMEKSIGEAAKSLKVCHALMTLLSVVCDCRGNKSSELLKKPNQIPTRRKTRRL